MVTLVEPDMATAPVNSPVVIFFSAARSAKMLVPPLCVCVKESRYQYDAYLQL